MLRQIGYNSATSSYIAAPSWWRDNEPCDMSVFIAVGRSAGVPGRAATHQRVCERYGGRAPAARPGVHGDRPPRGATVSQVPTTLRRREAGRRESSARD